MKVIFTKGDKRPVYCEDDRRALLLELSCVDEVIIFEEETPYLLIKSIKPDIIVKGGDYQVENVVGNDICEVKIFEYVKGYSTTKTIQNIVDR